MNATEVDTPDVRVDLDVYPSLLTRNAVAVPLFLLNAAGTVMAENEAARALMGTAASSLHGRSFSELARRSVDRSRLRAVIAAAAHAPDSPPASPCTVQWPAASNLRSAPGSAPRSALGPVADAIPRAIQQDMLDDGPNGGFTVPSASREALSPAQTEDVRCVRCTVRRLTAPPHLARGIRPADPRASSRRTGGDEVRLPNDPLIVVTVEDQSEVRVLQDILTRISDEERRRMGEDMHDLVASRLTIMSIRLQNLQSRMRAAGDRDYAASIVPILDAIQSAASRVRAMSHALCPVELKDTPLSEALDHLVTSLNEHHRPDISFSSAGLNGDAYPPDVRLHIFRIAHEAVHNAIKHARASWIRVDLSRIDGRLTLSVWDDGVGVTTDEWSDGDSSGIGHLLMQCRADVLGAALSVGTAPNGGTLLQLDWPIPDDDRSPA